MCNEKYPANFWRGISSKDFIENGVVLGSAFQFSELPRDDGYKELSINWHDCESALNIALNQKKESGKLQFSVGVAKLEFSEVVKLLHTHIENNSFSYERHPIKGNRFHGNLLLSDKSSKSIRSLISNTLAIIANVNITYQPNVND